ncbi:MAG: hypothetical protein ACJ8JD_08015, partial [Chthoniobacterales bacterium]
RVTTPDGPDEGKVVRAYEVMDRQLSHLVRMVDDLLEASRIDRGMLELNRDEHTVLVLVTHDPEIATLTERTIRLRNGEVVA